MKNIVFFLAVLTISVSSYAQKKSKIEGNKMVTDVFNSLEGYKSIEISDNLKVNLSQSNNEGYHLRTDENLVQVVSFSIIDSVLKISTTHKITSSKKMEINLTFKQLEKLTIFDDVELNSTSSITGNKLVFYGFGNSKYELDIKTNHTDFFVSNSSSGKLMLSGGSAKVILDDNAYIKSQITLTDLDLMINKRSDIVLEGDVSNLKLTATGSSDIKGKSLKVTTANLKTSNRADIHIYVSKELVLYANGKSNIYVYGNPEIKVDGLNDKSQIIKK